MNRHFREDSIPLLFGPKVQTDKAAAPDPWIESKDRPHLFTNKETGAMKYCPPSPWGFASSYTVRMRLKGRCSEQSVVANAEEPKNSQVKEDVGGEYWVYDADTGVYCRFTAENLQKIVQDGSTSVSSVSVGFRSPYEQIQAKSRATRTASNHEKEPVKIRILSNLSDLKSSLKNKLLKVKGSVANPASNDQEDLIKQIYLLDVSPSRHAKLQLARSTGYSVAEIDECLERAELLKKNPLSKGHKSKGHKVDDEDYGE